MENRESGQLLMRAIVIVNTVQLVLIVPPSKKQLVI